MLKFRKICVIHNQCCLASSEHQNLETGSNENKIVEIKESSFNSSFQKNMSRISSEMPKLTLIIIDTVHMIIGSEYEINPQGLSTSNRNIKDGCVYAGSLEKQGRVFINDIVLPEKEKGIGKRHFLIKHDKGNEHKEHTSYYLKDLGEGMGTFIRIENPIKLKSSYIISFGESHLITNINKKTLIIRFIDGPKVDYKK